LVSVYDLKPKFQTLLRPLCASLARAGVTANQVTITRMAGEDALYHVYYEFSFFSPDIDVKQTGGVAVHYRAPVVVLMNGTVIPPHRVDE